MSEPTQPSNNPGDNNTGPWNSGQQASPGGYPVQGAQGYNYPAPAGQPQGGYAYQGNPYGQESQVKDPARPPQVDLAFWLLIAGALLGLIALPIAVAYVNSPEYLDYVEELTRNAGFEIDSASLAAGVAAGTVTAVLSGLFGIAVRVGLAFLIRAGFNWARIIVTIFAVLSLFGLIGLFSTGVMSGVLTLLATLATLAAVALLFAKPSNAYFNQKKAYRQARKFGGYQG